MDANSITETNRQVIDEYTLIDGENITVYTHKLDCVGAELRKIMLERK